MPFNRLANLLYPPACLLCHTPIDEASSHKRSKAQAILCSDCRLSLPRLLGPVCLCCSEQLSGAFDKQQLCLRCREKSPAYAKARCAWNYADGMQKAIAQFKYHRHWRFADFFAEEMAETAKRQLPVEIIDWVSAVPAYWLKRCLRGYFPAGELACAVARCLNKPYKPNAITQTRWTATQTRLSAKVRANNVEGAFKADPRLAAGKTVLVVDDVLTSGATAQACSAALLESGARQVFFLTAARTTIA